MLKPRLLDLYCCAGGASAGYQRAGFDLVGIDIEPQPKYPFKFIQGDAIEYLRKHWREFDIVHASPPCQAYSSTSVLWNNQHPDLIATTRAALNETYLPYIIENVPGAPLINPFTLCGTMFGLRIYRHRLFECSFDVQVPDHPIHVHPNVKMGRPPDENEFVQAVGNFSGVEMVRLMFGCPWMNRYQLAQCIPPAYTELIGKQLLN